MMRIVRVVKYNKRKLGFAKAKEKEKNVKNVNFKGKIDIRLNNNLSKRLWIVDGYPMVNFTEK